MALSIRALLLPPTICHLAVLAIVPGEMFDAVQRRLEENLRLARRNAKRDYLLSGLLKHACGSSMGGRTHRGVTYHHCYRSQSFKAPIDKRGEPQPCSCKWANGEALETAVWDTMAGLLKQPELLVQEMERLTQPDSATREALEEELAQVRKRLEQLPGEERRLVEGYRKGFYADSVMREEMERVRGERDAAEERHRELERRLARLDRALSYKGHVEDFARRLGQGLDQMDCPQRRELLRLLVEDVTYDAGQITTRLSSRLGMPRRGMVNCILYPNGFVEGAQRTHTEEFYEVKDFPLDMAGLNRALQTWEHVYNTIRPHQSLDYLTPQQYLRKFQETRKEEVSLMC